MDVFEAKLRGCHPKAVQTIMARTTGFYKQWRKPKAMKPKGDNNSTYLEKYNLDLNNLNLAKRILLCESEHNHKFYQQQWKKTQSLIRLRSNFKRGLCNQQPRIYKYQAIQGKGSCLVTITFSRFNSSPIDFRADNMYSIQALVKNQAVTPTNSIFYLNSLQKNPMSFYIPNYLKKRKLLCKITQVKGNQTYDRGHMYINLKITQDQQIQIKNNQDKVIAVALVNVDKTCQKVLKQKCQTKNSSNQQRSLTLEPKKGDKIDEQDEKQKCHSKKYSNYIKQEGKIQNNNTQNKSPKLQVIKNPNKRSSMFKVR